MIVRRTYLKNMSLGPSMRSLRSLTHPEYYDKVKLILRALGLPNDS